jgi:acetate---CoA ligase (ADP-forming)
MNFESLFEPRTMAVIGVSLTNDSHPANVIYNKNRLRYPLQVFPVNPQGGKLHGERVFRDVSEIPDEIDLAVVAVRADNVPEVFRSCIRKGVHGAVVVSGGFAEAGRQDLQEQIVSIARGGDFPFIGPNCIGVYSPSHVDTFFLANERVIRPEPGNVALVSQSGGILVDQMIKFAGEGTGMSRAVSIGNKAMLTELDLLRYLETDPKTGVIAFYIEGFGHNEGREFVLAASACCKPVIVLKAGKTAGGQRAVSSHTASLAGDYEVVSAILKQHGIVEARNEQELVNFCEALSRYPQSIQGKIGIVTGSGGHGALATDVCSSLGLAVPVLPVSVQQELREGLSPSVRPIATVANPVDLTGSCVDDDFLAAVGRLSAMPEIDCVIALLLPYTPGVTLDLGARLSRLHRQTGKPLIAYVPHVERYRILIEGFELNGVPVAHSIEGAILMAEAMRRYHPC